jgi:RNA polymerase sigma-70 factor (ECF subfamily)
VNAKEEQLRALMLRGLSGDDLAYHACLKSLSAHLRAYFRRRMPGLPDDVEDLVQETLLAVHNRRHTYETTLPLTAWVHAIAGYKLVDLLRRRGTHEGLNDALDDTDEAAFGIDDAASEARRDLAKLLAQLPDRHRLPIQYVKLDGLTVVEAARKTGMSESAIKVGIHRGLKALAARIRGET